MRAGIRIQVFLHSDTEQEVVSGVVGAQLSQEIIKAVTRTGVPIQNTLGYDTVTGNAMAAFIR